MALWMDMTNSLKVWQGGVVGIVRAELEIAKNLKRIYPELKICADEPGKGIKEIPEEKLEWLWDADSVVDAYLIAMERTHLIKEESNKETVKETEQDTEMPAGLRNAYAYSDSRLRRMERGANLIKEQTPKLLRPFGYLLFGLAYIPVKGYSSARVFLRNRKEKKIQPKAASGAAVEKEEFYHPFQEGDTAFSVGWYTSNKEEQFSKVKAELSNFYLVYLVYDLIIIKEGTTQFYPEREEFRRYFEWITNNCDMVLYGGKTAQTDAENYQRKKGLRVPQGDYIKFGADVREQHSKLSATEVLKKFDIQKPYILTVGSIEPRKNHEVLYKAYSVLASEKRLEGMPEIIIVGGEYRCENFRDAVRLDPKIKGKIKILHPNDEELDVLYQNCLFVVLPTLYEGWSLTLPEALGYGKLCLTSDVPPLREVGENFVEYVDALNPVAWAEVICKYAGDRELIRQKEELIKREWKKVTWSDSANKILDALKNLDRSDRKGTLYYDLSLVWSLSFSGAHVSGILRTTLILARYLAHIFPQMHFFALSTVRGYIEINRKMIADILGVQNIEESFEHVRYALMNAQGNRETDSDKAKMGAEIKEAAWLMCSILPQKMQKSILKKRYGGNSPTEEKGWLEVPFHKNDMIFSAGTGYDIKIYDELLRVKEEIGFRFVQLIYDFTPVLLPQVHRKETIEYYLPFLEYSSKLSDVVFYGGETAMRDGIAYQKENNLPVREGRAIRFGSNIVAAKKENKQADKDILKGLGVTGAFIIAVGSIEVRKNHETLYLAYLRMMETEEELPQLIFVGYPGWKTEELIRTICSDERIWDKILIRTPSDEQLDVLYRHCMFTVLASHYEGWSLTLPESLNYGKFCIASKVEPLMEIGKDFIDYVQPWDVAGWAEKILYYFSHPEVLKEREAYIEKEWHAVSWEECAEQVAKELRNLGDEES